MSTPILMLVGGKERALSFAGGPPVLRSEETPWKGIKLEQHRMQSVEGVGETGPRDGEHGMLVVVDGQIDITLRDARRVYQVRATPGSVSYLSGERRPNVLRFQGRAEAVALQIGKDWFERVLLEEAPRAYGSGDHFKHDATVLSLVLAMRDEVARGAPTGRLYAESLSVALLSYVMERVPTSSARVRGGLAEEQQRRLRNYIRDHLGEDLSLRELSDLIGRSPRQFSSLFKRSFGTTPHQYLLEARLTEGARLLGQGGCDIAEVAFNLGFCSQSHFASAFRRAYGVTPGQYVVSHRPTTTTNGAA